MSAPLEMDVPSADATLRGYEARLKRLSVAPAPVRLAMRTHLGLCAVGVFVILAVAGPWLAPYNPDAIDLAHEFAGPNRTHWLGTAENGIDLFSALLHGARLAGTIALYVITCSAVLGTALGVIAGYFGGVIDHVISGVADLVQAFPATVLNIAILALVAEPSVTHVVVALVVSGWVIYARLARAQVFTLREADYVTAARALGTSRRRILFRHIVPNLRGAIIVQATTGVGGVILVESTLSFLGLGPGAVSSWGALLNQGTDVLLRFPHVTIYSGIAIALTVYGFNTAGDWLRDRLEGAAT